MIKLTINTQPNDETCGATCLHAVYRHYGLSLSLDEIRAGVQRSLSGGTLTPLLGTHALQHGFETTLYTNNLIAFDPSWFEPSGACDESLITNKLLTQLHHKHDENMVQLTNAYVQYFQHGGKLHFLTITAQLLKNYFQQNIPVIAALSATYLYNCPRERFTEGVSIFDDIQGTPCGHFVVLCGYDEEKKHIVVADPHRENPLANDNYYKVNISRLINAIMLGVLTHDGHLLIIKPQGM